MPRTNVYINRQLCDFEQVEGLPIQLNVSVDKFLSVDTRMTGTKLDGGLQQLVLPATKRNSAILSELWELGSESDATLDIIIDVDGNPVFAGKCRPAETLRSWTAPKQYFLDLFGGSGDPLSQLEGVLLTDIDMGGIATDNTTVQGSWAHNFGTGAATATFAPVNYGAPVANEPTKLYHQHADLRPHIPYTTIFNKVFESHLGYKINSTFYETEAFRRMHYMFGVGNQWERTTTISGYTFEYSLNSALSGSPPVGINKIPYGTVVSDPAGMWDGAGHFFTAPIDGYYSFDIVYKISNVSGSYTLRIWTFGQGEHNMIQSAYPVSGTMVVEHRATLPKQFYSAGDTFFIMSNTQDTNVEVNADSYIKGTLDKSAYMGAEVKVQSCLHKEPVKDFLRGVFHQFNLTGRFEVITKQFYFEPRMNYFTSSSYGSGHAAAFTRTERDGYYQRPLTALDDWTDKIDPGEIKVRKPYPFGDNIILSYKKASDPTTKTVLAEVNSSLPGLQDTPPVYGIKYPVSDVSTGLQDKVSENPYFYPLPNASVNGIQPASHLPAMLPDGYDFSDPLPTPTFEFNPTCGFYYGTSSNLSWIYEGSGRTLPMMYMQPPQGGSNYVRNQDCITYNDTGDYIFGQISDNKGLAANYYLNYLQCIKHGEIVEATVKLSPSEVFSENFTKMKRFLGNNFILLNIGNYNPLTSQATCIFFRYTYGLTQSELTAIEDSMSEIYCTYISK